MKLYIRNIWVIKFLSIWIDLIISLWSETHLSVKKFKHLQPSDSTSASISKKRKHPLRSEVSWWDQTNRSSTASIYNYKGEDRSTGTCLASGISTQMEPYPRLEFTPGSIWTYWMLIDRQMESQFLQELNRWISKVSARHLQVLHQDIFWSPW